MSSKRTALLGLLLLVPFPSIGVLSGMIFFPDTVLGRFIFAASKVWILLLPLIWTVLVEKNKLSLSKPENGGFGVSTGLGALISIFIIGAYVLFGKIMIDPQVVKEMAAEVGLDNKWAYLGGAAYWTVINSLLEEYVWRWFVFKQCRVFMAKWGAIALSAGFFTIHHIIAMQVYFSWPVTIIASLGIFIGGAVWSWCYLRYKSVWPGYLSHAIVDAAVFGIGYFLIF